MFEVRQKVWDVAHGEGEVVEVFTYDCNYPVLVEFDNGSKETYTIDGKYDLCVLQTLFPYPVEIVRKAEKPSIDWDHVAPKYKYLALDSFGYGWLFCEKPVLGVKIWGASEGKYALMADGHASFVPGECDWKESLVKRPD